VNPKKESVERAKGCKRVKVAERRVQGQLVQEKRSVLEGAKPIEEVTRDSKGKLNFSGVWDGLRVGLQSCGGIS